LSTTRGAHYVAPSTKRLWCGIQFAIIMAPATHQRSAFAIPRTTAIRPLAAVSSAVEGEHVTGLKTGSESPSLQVKTPIPAVYVNQIERRSLILLTR